MSKLYQLPVETQGGEFTTLAEYQGKVLLIVNTATGCGLTPQYEGLEQLYQTFKNQGFEILDFPCNQFLNQAPGSDQDINTFCQLHYQTSFPRFKKIAVNGKETCPLYAWLKEEKPGQVSKAIKWNFTKFLIDRDGRVIERFSPQTEPADLAAAIKKLL